MSSPIVLCQQTADVNLARECFRTLTAGGIEGLVIKEAGGSYPTVPGQRVWAKVKAQRTLDMLVVGFTGDTEASSALVLALPGDVDEEGRPVTAGSTTTLSKVVGRSLSRLLQPTGETFERILAWRAGAPTRVTVVTSFVVEVEADASAPAGVLRHAARLHRARPDLDPTEAN